MNILAVASEIYPLVKTGGLADVAGALPPALAKQGIATRTLIPGYPAVMAKLSGKREALRAWTEFYGGPARVLAGEAASLDLLVLDAPHLFDRPGGPYAGPLGSDWPDNWRRFAALSRAAADVAEGALAGWRPDIVHAHDWQAGLTPAYLRYSAAHAVPSVMTIHNLAFQGQFSPAIFGELGLPPGAMSVDGVEYYGGVGYLKAGLRSASAITTVSPTYAREIRTPEFGMGLDGLIRARGADVHGIVNGIDVEHWTPSSDPHLAASFGIGTLRQRSKNRRAVEQRFGIEPGDGPLFAVISRLTWQKGMDVLAAVTDDLLALGGRLAVLGSGDQALEGALLAAAARHRGRIGVVIGYDEALSHLIQGGADAILIPSRFEPCGLTQLYGLRYGCVPVVARTGGLADTIIDANEAALSAGVATGFQFGPLAAETFRDAISRAADLFQDRKQWTALQKQGMSADVSWERSAARYAELYRSLGVAA